MKKALVVLCVLLCVGVMAMMVTVAHAKKHLPEERGKALFIDKAFAGGKKACNDCHPNGGGLQKSADKKDFGKVKTLPEMINYCIENASGGKAIPLESEQMKDMVAYIKSLKP